MSSEAGNSLGKCSLPMQWMRATSSHLIKNSSPQAITPSNVCLPAKAKAPREEIADEVRCVTCNAEGNLKILI